MLPLRRLLYIIFQFTIFSFIVPKLSAEVINWNKGRGYDPFIYATTDGIIINNTSDTLLYDYYRFQSPASELILKFRGKNINGSPAKKYPYITSTGSKAYAKNPHWGFFLTGVTDTIVFTINGTEKSGMIETLPCLELNVYFSKEKIKEQILITENVNPFVGDNLWEVALENENLTLKGGDHSLEKVFQKAFDMEATGFGFLAGWGDKLKIQDIRLQTDFKNQDHFVANNRWTDNLQLETYLENSEDEMEGYWSLFDRELEENLLKMGGDYTLACLKEGDNYKFIYLSGASINSKEWKPGEIKMQLTPTAFSGIYNVVWIDAMKETMNKDIKAQIGEGETLQIQFPYQSSKIRLRRIPK